MYLEDRQKYNKFVYEAERDASLKEIVLEDMGFSVRFLTSSKKEKNIFVRGEYRKVGFNVKKGDVIEILLPEEKSNFIPQDLGIDVLYEDFDLIVLNKPPYMVVHPTKSHKKGTLANFCQFYIEKSGEKYRPRFVNRLDMNTSGLVIVAKNSFAHHNLSKQMQDNLVNKEYFALAIGRVDEDIEDYDKIEDGHRINGQKDNDEFSYTIDRPIYRPTDDSIHRVVDVRGQRSVTHFNVEKHIGDYSLLRLKLETGRTHQIRVHLKSIGHPIYADDLYGESVEGKRQLLHAAKLEFYQPRTKKKITVESELPGDFFIE